MFLSGSVVTFWPVRISKTQFIALKTDIEVSDVGKTDFITLGEASRVFRCSPKKHFCLFFSISFVLESNIVWLHPVALYVLVPISPSFFASSPIEYQVTLVTSV